MVHENRRTRRDVLRLTGIALAAAGATGVASANHTHPSVTTDYPTVLSDDAAILYGTLEDFGDGNGSADVYFEWDYKSSSDFSFSTAKQPMTSTGSFNDSLTGLLEDTWYKFRAVAVADGGAGDRGDTMTFKTYREGYIP